MLPFAIFLIGCYLIGLRVYQHRVAEPNVPVTIADENLRKLADGETINLNSATKEELMRIDGIGEVLATRVIGYREKIGVFRDVNQIKNVEGIGDKMFESIKKYLSIEQE